MVGSKVIIDLSTKKFSDPEIIAKTGIILEDMTGNQYFETPEPPLLALTSVLDIFVDAYNKSGNGGRQEIALKNIARQNLENILRQLAQYVQTASFGQDYRIISSGFDMAKKHEPVGPLEQATGLVVRLGINSGEVTLECDVIPKAVSYFFEYTEAPITPESNWISNVSTKRLINLSGLISGKHYEFRVTGINSDPTRNWSEPVRKMII